MYDGRCTMEILARLRAARQSESEGGRREHGVTVVGGAGRWTGALDGAYLRITNYELRFGKFRAVGAI